MAHSSQITEVQERRRQAYIDEMDSATIAGADTPGSETGAQTDIPESAQDVVEIEGSAGAEAPLYQESTVTAWLFRPHDRPQQFELEQLLQIVADDANLAWVDFSSYTERDLRELGTQLKLHENSVNAALDAWHRPRLDVFPDYFFVTVTVAQLDPKQYRVQARQLDLFVGRNFLISVHKQPLPFFSRVLVRARQSPELIRLDSAFMLYVILDQLLEYYEDLTEQIDSDIEEIEERGLTDTSDSFLADLLRFKRYVFALSRLVDQHRNVFAAFIRADFPFVADDEVEPYYRDLEGRLDRLLSTLAAAKEAVNGAFDIYVSHVSHRTNQVMKVLTIVSTTLLPTTVILGFFGTSFDGIPLYDQTGFWAMVMCIVGITSLILLLFRRWKWF
jgi:magnesium transporter